MLDAASAHASELARLITLFGRLLRQQRAATQSHQAQVRVCAECEESGGQEPLLFLFVSRVVHIAAALGNREIDRR